MWQDHKIHWLITCFVVVAFSATGCSTNTNSLKYNKTEVKLIPAVALQKVLSPQSDVTVKIFATNVDGPMTVKRFEGPEDVIAINESGKEIEIKASDVTKIVRIRHFSKGNDKDLKAEDVGEFVMAAPFIPVAIAMTPFLQATGMDMKKNSEDESKARLVYKGLSKNDLLTYLGNPTEKYLCLPKKRINRLNEQSRGEEVWVYEEDRVLRGGRSLFIDIDDEEVYYNSTDSSYFKDLYNCSFIE